MTGSVTRKQKWNRFFYRREFSHYKRLEKRIIDGAPYGCALTPVYMYYIEKFGAL